MCEFIPSNVSQDNQPDMSFFPGKKPLKKAEIRQIKENSASGVLLLSHIYEVCLSII